jgi:hypothetical protein
MGAQRPSSHIPFFIGVGLGMQEEDAEEEKRDNEKALLNILGNLPVALRKRILGSTRIILILGQTRRCAWLETGYPCMSQNKVLLHCACHRH